MSKSPLLEPNLSNCAALRSIGTPDPSIEARSFFRGPLTNCAPLPSSVPGLAHSYNSSNPFNVNITGNLEVFGTRNVAAFSWGASLLSVDFSQAREMRISSLSGAFKAATTNFQISGDIPPSVRDLSNVFREASGFDGVGISSWNTSAITNMDALFFGATNFTGNVSAWNVSQVRSMRDMFSLAERFNGQLKDWNTSSVTDMTSTFAYATGFNQPLDTWDVSSVTDMRNMFTGSRFNQPLNVWRTGNVRNMVGMFSLAAFNRPLAGWNVSSVTDMSSMFEFARFFNQPLNSWNVSSVTSFSRMFYQAESFNQPLDQWDVSSATSFIGMFGLANAFNGSVGSWNLRSARSLTNMFSLTPVFNSPIGQWDVSRVTDMQGMFFACQSFNQPIGSWNTRSVVTMISMFESAQAFNQPIGAWNVSRVANMNSMFRDAASFNQTLESWNVAAVTRMDLMFLNATKFSGSLRSWCVRSIPSYPPFFSNDSALLPGNLPRWGTCPLTIPPSAILRSPALPGPPEIIEIDVDACTLFLSCPNAPASSTIDTPSSFAPLAPTVVTIPSNTSFVLIGNATTPPNTVIVFLVSSSVSGSVSAGSITTSSCLNLTGSLLQLFLESSTPLSILDGSKIELISSSRPDCFTETLPSTVVVQTRGGCSTSTVTGTKQIEQSSERVSLSVVFTVRSGSNTCSSPSATNAADGSSVPVAAIAGSIAAVVAVSVAVAAVVFILRRRRFDSAKRDVASKLVQNRLK